ncbi:MAG: D-ribose pyranase [Ilumatobacter coccineus]|uniref:D-ribose pyranase n=1 Tax=Ilumatobacter coccineus TaxID=467094 RepID=A0A2G6K7X5_9ACTN|nr:MAG: D-ribose pyranase [Ilumatobacter coccineus]
MKRSGVIHPQLLEVLAAAGHGDLIVLADAGLRIPSHARRIDLGITCGVPTMAQVLAAVSTELVIEAAEVATEFADWNPDVYAEVMSVLNVEPSDRPHVEPSDRPHGELMADMAERAYAYVKTGDCSAYSSVVLTCGVSYLDEAIALYDRLHS